MISLHIQHILNIKVKVNFTLEQATKAQKGSIGIALHARLLTLS
jgi:hypothetical protein